MEHLKSLLSLQKCHLSIQIDQVRAHKVAEEPQETKWPDNEPSAAQVDREKHWDRWKPN